LKLVERIVKVPRGYRDVEVVVSGCLHFGHAGTNEEAIRAMVRYVAAEPNRRLILLGDITDAISVSDPRFNPREVAPWLKMDDLSNRIILEAERAIAFLSPIKDRIDGLIEGNHERKPRLVAQVDLHRVLWKGLGIESLGEVAFLQYTFVGRDRGTSDPISIYCQHGAGGASQVGGVLNNMIKKAKDFPGAAAYIGAHHHRNGATTAESISYDPVARTIRRASPLAVTVGTFMEYYSRDVDTYGQTFLMSPHGIGPGKLRLRPWAKDGERVGYSFPYWT